MDEAVLQWFRNEHKLEIGLGMSEKIKKTVGSAMKMKSADIAVKGRDLVSGIPKTIEVSSDEVRLALKDPVNQIVEAVKDALNRLPRTCCRYFRARNYSCWWWKSFKRD